MSSSRLWVVCPCYFDVPSFLRVRSGVLEVVAAERLGVRPQFVLVDDTAGRDHGVVSLLEHADIRVLTPPYNLGHQGAIAYALRRLSGETLAEDLVVTMDSDGQDRPRDLPALLAPLQAQPANLQLVSLARRTSRAESLPFKVSYLAFRAVFRMLTGTVVRSGSFAAFRGRFSQETIFHPHFDQCYASSLIGLPITVEMVPAPRGERYEGRSKMGFFRLFTHGVRMLMPFAERIAVRGLLASLVVLGAEAVAVMTVLALGLRVPPPWWGLAAGPLLLGAVSFLLFVTSSQTTGGTLRGLTEPVARTRDERPTSPPP